METKRRDGSGLGYGKLMRIDCPFADDSYIELPDTWKGIHALRHDEAIEKAQKANMPETWRSFSVSMALLDNWQLPGLNGNPDKWDLAELDLRVMAWVKNVTLPAYYANFTLPKNS